MDTDKALEYLGTLGSFIGAYLNANMNILGFVVWTVGNIFWITMGIRRRMWGVVFTFSVFTVLNIYGIISWIAAGLGGAFTNV